MLIAGEWFVSDDGVARPVLDIVVRIGDSRRQGDRFLVDSGADRTVFSRTLLARLQTSGSSPPEGHGLVSAAGAARFVLVEAVLELSAVHGQPASVRGEFAAFTDEATLEMSILGRDVLDNFDVILSRRRNEVLLLAGNHLYQVARS
jgi:hypothetical protein